MQVRIINDAPLALSAGALVVPFFSQSDLDGVAKEVDAKIGGVIAEALRTGEIRGRLAEHVLIYAPGEPYRRVLAIGLGERGAFEPYLLARYAGTAVRYLGRRNVEEIAIALPEEARGREAACASFVAEGAVTGTFDTAIYQEKPDRRVATKSVAVLSAGFDTEQL